MIAGCNKDGGKSLDQAILGEWHSTSISVNGDIYLSFSEDKTYELYQKIGDGPHYLYKGKYNFDGQILSGTYSDYTPWAHDYKVTRSGGSLTLTSVASPDYSVTYKKESIPESVKTHYMPATKAVSVAPIL